LQGSEFGAGLIEFIAHSNDLVALVYAPKADR